MTSLWHCPACNRDTLCHSPVCIHCGPESWRKVVPVNDEAKEQHELLRKLDWSARKPSEPSKN